jgi:hypothetical protein
MHLEGRLVHMKILTWSLLLIGLLTGAVTAGGEEKGKMNPEISLPSESSGWNWDGNEEQHTSKTLFGYMDGAAELYLAYGFQGLKVRRFERKGQSPITVELYEMASSADAYGVFSFERQDEPAGIGQGSEFGGGMLRFWKGRYFASIYAEGEGEEVEAALIKIGRAVADAVPETGPEPELTVFIPGKDLGLVDRSIRFFRSHVLLNQRFFIAHQNILNLSRETEALLAQYLRDGQKVHLLLIRYSDSKAAGEAYQSFMKAYLPDAGGKDRARTEDRKWTLGRQAGEWVLVVFGAPAEADAESLVRTTEEKLPRRR